MAKKAKRKLTDDEAVELLIDALIALGRSDCETLHARTALDAGRQTMIGLITGLKVISAKIPKMPEGLD